MLKQVGNSKRMSAWNFELIGKVLRKENQEHSNIMCHVLSRVQLFVTPGTEPVSPVAPALQVDSLPTEPSGKPYGNICSTLKTYLIWIRSPFGGEVRMDKCLTWLGDKNN